MENKAHTELSANKSRKFGKREDRKKTPNGQNLLTAVRNSTNEKVRIRKRNLNSSGLIVTMPKLSKRTKLNSLKCVRTTS